MSSLSSCHFFQKTYSVWTTKALNFRDMDDLDQQLAHLQLMNTRDLSPMPPGLVKKVGPAVPPKPHKKVFYFVLYFFFNYHHHLFFYYVIIIFFYQINLRIIWFFGLCWVTCPPSQHGRGRRAFFFWRPHDHRL